MFFIKENRTNQLIGMRCIHTEVYNEKTLKNGISDQITFLRVITYNTNLKYCPKSYISQQIESVHF